MLSLLDTIFHWDWNGYEDEFARYLAELRSLRGTAFADGTMCGTGATGSTNGAAPKLSVSRYGFIRRTTPYCSPAGGKVKVFGRSPGQSGRATPLRHRPSRADQGLSRILLVGHTRHANLYQKPEGSPLWQFDMVRPNRKARDRL
jgi:hypothetical protein